MQLFFFVCPSSPSVALGEDGLPRVSLFPECHALLGTRGRPSSPSAILPRVQHSGKIVFPECPIFGTRGSAWHSGKIASPVVPLGEGSSFRVYEWDSFGCSIDLGLVQSQSGRLRQCSLHSPHLLYFLVAMTLVRL
jgi:hypothetical protein